MEAELDNRTYELAYHLNPEIEETQLNARVQELQDLILQNGGSVLASKDPRRTHLSYPIGHKNYAYFGILDFKAPVDGIEKLNGQMKLQTGVLRYLVVKKVEGGKSLRALGERARPRLKTHEPTTPGREATKPQVEVKPEQMEKEIEEALEKI